MSKDYRYLDENGKEWIITQEEMDEKVQYLKDNMHEENDKKYVLLENIVEVIPEGHPMRDYWRSRIGVCR